MGTFSLSQAIQSQVGSTSMAAMELAQPAAAQERTIETITEEILHYQAVGGDAVIQIGQRLIEAKAAIPHGGWLPWLSEQVHYSERTAQRLMKIARDCSNPTLVSDLGLRKALAIFTLPQAEQEDFLREHDAVDMTAEQLEQAIRERDEAIATAKAEHAKAAKANDELLSERLEMNRFRDSNGKLHEENKRLSEKIKELESRPIDVAVQVDEEAVEKAKAEARAAAEAEWREKVKAQQTALDEARDEAARALAKLRHETEQDKAEDHRCVTGLNPHGTCGAASYCDKNYSCCIACPSPCNSYCGFLPATNDPQLPPVTPIISPIWYVGIPPKDGLYYCEFDCTGMALRTPARWDSVNKWWAFNHGAIIDAKIVRWWPLPED